MQELQIVKNKIADGGLIFLHGELGAGKTTFIQKLGMEMGIDSKKIKSPTYSYIRQYKLGNGQNFFHIDLYRIETEDRYIIEEIEELLENPQNIVAIEWAERIEAEIQKPDIEVSINYKNGDREFKLKY